MSDTRLQFIDSNPATEAFQRGRREAQNEMLRNEQISKAERENYEGEASQGDRLRRITADTNLASTHADVAAQKAPYDVSSARSSADLSNTTAGVARATALPLAQANVQSAQSNARTAGSVANVNEATEPARIETAQAGAKSATAGARSAGSNAYVNEQTESARINTTNAGARTATSGANVAQGTEAAKIGTANVGLRQAETNLHTSQAKLHLDEINLIEQGHADVAMENARRRGEVIPDNILQNAQARGAYKTWLEDAIRSYPNAPEDQDAYVQGKKKEYDDKGQQPLLPNQQPGAQENPLDVHTPPEGAPKLPQSSFRDNFHYVGNTPAGKPISLNRTTGDWDVGDPDMVPKGGAGGGRESVYRQKLNDWRNAHPGDEDGALRYANGQGQLSPAQMYKSANQQALTEINGGMMGRFNSQAERAAAVDKRRNEHLQRMQEISKAPVTPGATPAPTAPAPPPAPPPPATLTPGATPAATISRPTGPVGTRENPARPVTQQDFNDLPAGTVFLNPDDNNRPYTKR